MVIGYQSSVVSLEVELVNATGVPTCYWEGTDAPDIRRGTF